MRRNEKGAALLMVLVTLVVLSILAAAFIVVGGSEYKLAVKEEDRVKAYYVARSGADAVAAAILKGDIPVDGYTDGHPVTFTGEFDGMAFRADVTKNGEYVNIDSATSDSGINITNNKAGLLLKKRSVNAQEIFTQPVTTSGAFTHVRFDAPTTTAASISAAASITSSGIYLSISTNNNEELTFDTSGGSIKIYTDTLNVKDKINIVGGGRVSIYVYSNAAIQTNKAIINNAPPNNYNQLFLYIRDGASLDIRAQAEFNGFIYGPYASSIQIDANSAVNGAVVGPGTMDPHTTVNYQSPGNVTMDFGYVEYSKLHWYD